MNPPKIALIVVDLPLDGPFDYAIGTEFQEKIAVGQRVKVLFNRRETVGVVVGFKQKSAFPRLNPILEILDTTTSSVDNNAFNLAKALSAYYGCSLGEAIFSYLPNALRRGQAVDLPVVVPVPERPGSSFCLVQDETLRQSWVFVMEKAKEILARGQSIIILMPSLEAIEQAKQKLEKDCSSKILVLDKKLTPKKELEVWLEIRQGAPSIILGTLTAIFAPAPNLGLIAIFEEENTVYKEEQSPFFRMQKIAELRSQLEGAKVILISSAPSVETYKEATAHKWEKVTFVPEKYCGFQVIDMSNYKSRKSTFLSFPLQNVLYQCLEQKKRVVLLMNRKGFTTMTRCACGFTMRCSRCDVNLTFMYAQQKLVCRHCGETKELPKVCPSCQKAYLQSMGGGIEKLQSDVARYYPQAKVGLYDRDSKTFPVEANIIIATQAILKVQQDMAFDVIVVVDFDAQLNRFDFRSANKVFSLLINLRLMAKEKLLVQTMMRNDYVLKAIEKMNFEGFYRKELSFRKELGFPPAKHLILLVVRGRNEEFVLEQVKLLCEAIKAKAPQSVEISDPHPDVVPKLRDKYRFTIMLKAKSAKDNLKLVKSVLGDFKKKRDLVITINVDP
ncbi:MAG: primosomal protein N' [Candidatus Omnitrophica bacterium]|nr:primosomal protein N' [Candidatus Omnitrophota bacterium]